MGAGQGVVAGPRAGRLPCTVRQSSNSSGGTTLPQHAQARQSGAGGKRSSSTGMAPKSSSSMSRPLPPSAEEPKRRWLRRPGWPAAPLSAARWGGSVASTPKASASASLSRRGIVAPRGGPAPEGLLAASAPLRLEAALGRDLRLPREGTALEAPDRALLERRCDAPLTPDSRSAAPLSLCRRPDDADGTPAREDRLREPAVLRPEGLDELLRCEGRGRLLPVMRPAAAPDTSMRPSGTARLEDRIATMKSCSEAAGPAVRGVAAGEGSSDPRSEALGAPASASSPTSSDAKRLCVCLVRSEAMTGRTPRRGWAATSPPRAAAPLASVRLLDPAGLRSSVMSPEP